MIIPDRYLNLGLPFFDLCELLASLPTPKMRFAIRVQAITGLALTSVLVMLSSPKHHIWPGVEVQLKLAKAFNTTVDTLFPSLATRPGSLAYRYAQESVLSYR